MAVTHKQFGQFLLNALEGEFNYTGDTIKCALLANTYTPDQDVHDYWDDISANEVTGTGYTAGGQALTTKALTYDAATNVVKLDADDVSWTSSTITARYAVVYKEGGTAATSPLISYVDFGQDESSSDGTFTVSWHADGIATVTVA